MKKIRPLMLLITLIVCCAFTSSTHAMTGQPESNRPKTPSRPIPSRCFPASHNAPIPPTVTVPSSSSCHLSTYANGEILGKSPDKKIIAFVANDEIQVVHDRTGRTIARLNRVSSPRFVNTVLRAAEDSWNKTIDAAKEAAIAENEEEDAELEIAISTEDEASPSIHCGSSYDTSSDDDENQFVMDDEIDRAISDQITKFTISSAVKRQQEITVKS